MSGMSTQTVITPSRQKSEPHRVLALDGLRGVAIITVFLSHFGGGHQSKNVAVHLWSVIADAGWVGVDLFFVLSGFLITGILYDTAHDPARIKKFYARRALRIFPIFYGVLFALLLLTPLLHLQWAPGHILYFVYLSNMMPIFTPHLRPLGAHVELVHLWSLAVEEQFYLLWPWVVWLVKDRVQLLRISLIGITFALVLRFALVFHGEDPFIIYSLLFTRADSLLCGGALALFVRGPKSDWMPVRTVLVVSTVCVAAVFAYAGSGHPTSRPVQTVGFTFLAILCTCLVYLAQQGRGWIVSIGELPVLRFFGRYSYGLYLYHALLFGWLFPKVYWLQGAVHSVLLGGILYVSLALGLSVLLAVASYHLFEERILRLKRYF